jgi:Flp pilus assembly protein TadB
MTAHEIRTSRGHAAWHGPVLLLVVLAFAAVAAAPALAVEEATPAAGGEEEQLSYDQLRESSSRRAQEFFPEEYEEPSFFRWISVPVLIAGLLMALALLGAYLWWQPRFAAERRQKERR